MKVVFLDFDGVLNSLEFLQREPGPLDRLDPVAIAHLNTIVQRSGAHVVISSSWRLSRSSMELRHLLEQLGFAGTIAGCTPDLSGAIRFADYGFIRCSEIRAWLAQCVQPLEHFVVLDDAELEEIEPNLVRTTFERGLMEEHVSAALQVLRSETPAESAGAERSPSQ